jgi:hypothetical protein
VSVEVDDALSEAFYHVRQLAGKERKKLSKETLIETLLQVALEELAEKADKSPVILKVLEKISQ